MPTVNLTMDIYCFGLKSFCGIENDFFPPQKIQPTSRSLALGLFFNGFYISEKYIHIQRRTMKRMGVVLSVLDSESVNVLSSSFFRSCWEQGRVFTGSAVICCWYKQVSHVSTFWQVCASAVWKNRYGVEHLCFIQNRQGSINVGLLIRLTNPGKAAWQCGTGEAPFCL